MSKPTHCQRSEPTINFLDLSSLEQTCASCGQNTSYLVHPSIEPPNPLPLSPCYTTQPGMHPAFLHGAPPPFAMPYPMGFPPGAVPAPYIMGQSPPPPAHLYPAPGHPQQAQVGAAGAGQPSPAAAQMATGMKIQQILCVVLGLLLWHQDVATRRKGSISECHSRFWGFAAESNVTFFHSRECLGQAFEIFTAGMYGTNGTGQAKRNLLYVESCRIFHFG